MMCGVTASEAKAGCLSELPRLRACPGCEYSLEALPAEGVCPECGRAYDRTYLVLVGVGRGRWDGAAGGTWRGMAGQLVWIVLLVWMFAGRSGGQLFRSPAVVAYGVIAAMQLAVHSYARLFSSREPRMQLWLGREGIAQVGSTPEMRTAQGLASESGWLILPVILIASVLEAVRRPGVVSWSVIGGIVLLTGLTLGWRWWRRRGERGGGESYRPALWRWEDLLERRAEEISPGRMRVRVEGMRYWLGMKLSKNWAVDIEVDVRAEEAELLRRVMAG